jgi:hypothetical protein
MTEPRRLSSESEDHVERMLLSAGRAGAPPGAKQRALLVASGAIAASSLAAGGAAAGGAAAGGAAAVAKAGSLATLTWIGVFSVTGIGVVTSAMVLSDAHQDTRRTDFAASVASSLARSREMRPPPERSASAKSGDGETAAPVDPTAILTRPAPPARPTEAVAPATAVTRLPSSELSAPRAGERGSASASTLPAEIALLDQARGAIAVGEPARALAILDGHTARFPRGVMAPEAAVLRIEALVKAGDRPAATRFADGFLATAPTSPYTTRIQSLLTTANP